MCEIIIAHTATHDESDMVEYAQSVYRSMRDSLGIVAIEDAGDVFRYGIYKAVTPDGNDIRDFVNEYHDASERFIFHGRLATRGAVTERNAHPLEMDCPKCNIDYVIHNGGLWGDNTTRINDEYRGHRYATDVDSEVIAHSHGDVPTAFENGASLSEYPRQPAYILLNETAIYVCTSGAYHLTEHGEMAKPWRGIIPDDMARYSEIIMTPSGNN